MQVKFHGDAVNLKGIQLKVGDNAPKVKLVTKDLAQVEVGGSNSKYQVINVVPSLDTPVCQAQTRKFNEKAAKLSNATVFVVSVDLPFAQGRFCSTDNINNLTVASDFENKDFGRSYGLIVADGKLTGVLTRAVIIVDTNGKIVYQEICDEITNEPNYEAALKVLGA